MHFLFFFGNCVYKGTPELLDEEIIKEIKIYASKSTGYFTEEKRCSSNIFEEFRMISSRFSVPTTRSFIKML